MKARAHRDRIQGLAAVYQSYLSSSSSYQSAPVRKGKPLESGGVSVPELIVRGDWVRFTSGVGAKVEKETPTNCEKKYTCGIAASEQRMGDTGWAGSDGDACRGYLAIT